MKKLTLYQILTLLLPVQIVLVHLVSYFPGTVERYYSNGIYPYISKLFRIVFGWIPIAAGDILYFLLGLVILWGIIKMIRSRFSNLRESLFRLGAYLSVFYLLFHLFWGMNYYRDSLYTQFKLERRDYTVDELKTLSESLLKKLEEVHLEVTNNDTVEVTIPYTKEEILNKTASGYDQLAKVYPGFKYTHESIKKSLYSLPLTYMGFAGYLNPLTGEANVDYLVPEVSLAMISSHEVAHQVGIGSESGANFIGYLAATTNPDPYFQYSGYLSGFQFSVSALYYKDSLASKAIIKKIPRGIQKNIEESRAFWLSYQNKMEPFFKLFYDNYLKANQQKDGLQSYSNMIYLLAAYHYKYGMPQ
ncbi:MAG: DUF3810 domain-containing protein [Flavobacteriaceae bacterium]|nr:DUF3810 domain-containing protein [Flavobacteriaceae bacterium]